MRVRSTTYTDTSLPGNNRYFQRSSPTSSLALQSTGSIPRPFQYHFKTVSDVDEPGFHKKRRDGQLIVNPFNISTVIDDWGYHSGLFGETYYASWGGVAADLFEFTDPLIVTPTLKPSMTVDPELSDDLINKATVEVWSQKVDPEFALGVAVAEGRETLSFLLGILQTIRNPLKKLRDEVSATRKYPSGTSLRDVAWDASDDLASIWLSFRYGLMPIYYDIRDFLEADLDYVEKMRQTYRRSEASIDTTTASGVDGDSTWTSTKTVSVKAHAGLTVDYYWENKADFLRHVLGLNNPLELLWELTRLSFVVDWFVNIGETISSHTASASVLQEKGWVSLRTDINATLDVDFEVNNLDGATHVIWPFNKATQSKFSVRNMDRSVLQDPPFFPQISVNLDGYKFVDLASLVKTMTNI